MTNLIFLMPRAPSMTLQFRDVLAAMRNRISFVRKYLLVFASDAISLLLYGKFEPKTQVLG